MKLDQDLMSELLQEKMEIIKIYGIILIDIGVFYLKIFILTIQKQKNTPFILHNPLT